jgi:phospholipase/carboxylesterase
MRTHKDFVHRFVPGENGDNRTLLLLHGTGGAENDLLGLGRAISPTANLLSPRGKVLENGMPRFFRRFGEGVFDVEDLKFRANELADWIQTAATHYGLDATQITAAGYSNGANIAGAILLLRPEILQRAILLRSMLPFEPEQNTNLASTRIWLGAGERDSIVPRDNILRWSQLLQLCSADVTLRWHAGGHELSRDEIEAARIWFEN